MARVITAKIRREARAFRIWQHCNAREWNCTTAEVAEALDLSTDAVRAICVSRRWINRMRTLATDRHGPGRITTVFNTSADLDEALSMEAA